MVAVFTQYINTRFENSFQIQDIVLNILDHIAICTTIISTLNAYNQMPFKVSINIFVESWNVSHNGWTSNDIHSSTTIDIW